MRSSFAGLEMMRSALMVAQTAMDITGHNVANANTEGYSRQRVNIISVSSANPFEKFNPLAVDVAGQGVTTDGVERVRDEYLDGQFRNATSRQSRYQISAEGLSILEQSFQEMDDAGLYAAFGDLFDSFQDLANDPGNSEQMLLVRQQAIDLMDVFHRDVQQLNDAAQSYAERMDVSLGTRADVAYRNDYTYFLQPWKTGDDGAERFAREALALAEPDAVIYADSTTVAPLLYVQEVHKVRPDVKIVNGIVRSEGAPSYDEREFAKLVGYRPLYVTSNQPGYGPTFVLGAYDLVKAGPLWRITARSYAAD